MKLDLREYSFAGILLQFYSFLSRNLEFSAFNGSIVTKSKGRDLWHKIQQHANLLL